MVGNVCVGDSPLSHYVTGHVVPEEPRCTTKRQTTTQTGTWNRNGIEKNSENHESLFPMFDEKL